MQNLTIKVIQYDASKTVLLVKCLVTDEKGTDVRGFMVSDHLTDEFLKLEYKNSYHDVTVESGWIISINS